MVFTNFVEISITHCIYNINRNRVNGVFNRFRFSQAITEYKFW